jgi:hypothetical protein
VLRFLAGFGCGCVVGMVAAGIATVIVVVGFAQSSHSQIVDALRMYMPERETPVESEP